jgi:hypothetical protein
MVFLSLNASWLQFFKCNSNVGFYLVQETLQANAENICRDKTEQRAFNACPSFAFLSSGTASRLNPKS